MNLYERVTQALVTAVTVLFCLIALPAGVHANTNTLTLRGDLPVGSYTLMYENDDGVMDDYAAICTLEITDVGKDAVYTGLITENCAPVGATVIGVYNASGERISEIALGALAAPDLAQKQYTFAAISDVHIGVGDSVQDFTNATAFFDGHDEIEFAAICGDCVNDATKVSQLETYQSIVANVQTPLYVVTGNHEAVNLANAGKSYEDIKAYFKQNAHPNINQELYYSFEKNGDVYIMLGIYGNYNYDETFSDAELQWLYETLEANRNKRCFLFHHYFPKDGSGDAVNCYSSDGLRGYKGEVFYSLLRHYKNVIYLHGHSHAEFRVQELNSMNTIDKEYGMYSVHIPSLMWATYPNATGDEYVKNVFTGEGYIVDVYSNGIHLKGRDFENNKFSPIGSYWLDTTLQDIEANTYHDPTGTILNSNCNVLLSGGTWYKGSVAKSTITKITFADSYNETNYDESWNASLSDEGQVMVYRTGTELVIVGNENGVVANRDSSAMFSGFTGLIEIIGLETLDTSNIINLSGIFKNCSSLASVDLSGFEDALPADMAEVFSGCASLQSIDLSAFNLRSVNQYRSLFFGCSALKMVKFPDDASINVPNVYCYALLEGCTSLADMDLTVFSGKGLYLSNILKDCSSLKKATFGQNRVIACVNAFYDCNSLQSVDISGLDFSNIDNTNAMFKGCSNLASVILPESVTCIGNNAFLDCSNLATITIPAGVTSIEDSAFFSCTSLTKVIYCGTQEQWNAISVADNNANLLDAALQFHNYVNGTCTGCGDMLPYTVIFKDEDGKILSTQTYHWGDEVVAPLDPTKAEDDTYTYAFAGWDKAVVDCAGDATYTATYTATYIDYTVVFKDWNGNVLSEKTYHYGEVVVAPADPTKAEDDTYFYTFTGWDKEIVDCAGDAVYTAQYTAVPKMKGWVLDGNDWYYYVGGVKQTGWVLDGSTWYYMDAQGVMQTGWVLSGGTWYYMNSSGAMVTGWLQVGGTWYYFKSSGAMVTGWLQVGGTWYYFKSSGAMVTGWLQVGSTWYYFKSSGAMVTGWLQVGGTWYYFKSSGAMVTGWLYSGGVWYYFYDSGAMATNTYVSGGWIDASGVWHG